jgi:uncharacterized iron-regulated protein
MGPGTLVVALTLAVLLAAGGCSGVTPRLQDLQGADVVLLGEQHDDAGHQRAHADAVRALAAQGRLAALAIEMAESGTGTAGLPRDADEQQVRSALRWSEDGWPWQAYAPAIMAAVGAGVPVLGANLPRTRLRMVMADASLDAHLDAEALAAQREAIRAGHCDLLPAQQLQPMVRVQVARDRAMADTVRAAAVPGKTVLLLAGSGHVDPKLGVPRHLPPSLNVRPLVLARSAEAPAKDYCEEMRRQMGR